MTLVMVSDEAAGQPTASQWETRFTTEFLGALTRFFVLCDAEENVVGWSGYRRAYDRPRSRRLLHEHRTAAARSGFGSHLRSAAPHCEVGGPAPSVPTDRPRDARPTSRSNSRVPESDQSLVTAIGMWLGLDVDPTTGAIRGCDRRRRAHSSRSTAAARFGLVFSSRPSPGVDVGSPLDGASGPG